MGEFALGALICNEFTFRIQNSERRMNKTSQTQLATVQELVACFEALEEQWPQVPDLPNGIRSRDVIRRVLCALRRGVVFDHG